MKTEQESKYMDPKQGVLMAATSAKQMAACCTADPWQWSGTSVPGIIRFVGCAGSWGAAGWVAGQAQQGCGATDVQELLHSAAATG